MKSGWVDRDAEAIVAEGAKSGIDRDLALRIYTTRLLGRDPKLVLHGGGNTSLKEVMRDRLGADVEVLRVKSTGADMAMIDLAGLPAVRLSPLRKLRALGEIGDDELVGIERASLIDPAAANPSVEIMLHAFLPHKFVDHTHATAVLSVIDQPDGEKKCAEVFGGRLAFVPYVMPGFGLAKKAIEVFERAKPSDGLILSKHGIVTYGESAREAYERMIEMVSRAEEFVARRRKPATAPARRGAADVAQIAPIVRGACSEKDENDRRRLAPPGARIPRHRGGAQFRQCQGFGPLEPGRRGDAGPHHPHQELAAAAADARSRKTCRVRAGSARARGPIRRALSPLFRAAQCPRRSISSASSIPCPASCWCRGSACSAWAAPSAMPRSPPTSPKPGSKASATPRPSAASSRSPKPTCSIANIGRSSRPSSAPARNRRSPARSPPSPAPAARSAPRPRRHLPRPAPKSRCSTSISPRRANRQRRSDRRRCPSSAT